MAQKSHGKLSFSCRNLPTQDGEETVDPIVGCITTSEEGGEFNQPLGQTEHLWNKRNPKFSQTIEVEIPAGWKDRGLRFVVFDVDDDGAELKKSDQVASAICNASDLWEKGEVTLALNNGKKATITINSTWTGTNTKSRVRKQRKEKPSHGKLSFSCRNLPTQDGEETVDPIVGCITTSEEGGEFNQPLGQTEHLWNKRNPKFSQTIEVEIPAGWKDRGLRFVVFDVDDDGAELKKSDQVASAICNASDLWEKGEVTLALNNGKKATITINSTWTGTNTKSRVRKQSSSTGDQNMYEKSCDSHRHYLPPSTIGRYNQKGPTISATKINDLASPNSRDYPHNPNIDGQPIKRVERGSEPTNAEYLSKLSSRGRVVKTPRYTNFNSGLQKEPERGRLTGQVKNQQYWDKMAKPTKTNRPHKDWQEEEKTRQEKNRVSKAESTREPKNVEVFKAMMRPLEGRGPAKKQEKKKGPLPPLVMLYAKNEEMRDEEAPDEGDWLP